MAKLRRGEGEAHAGSVHESTSRSGRLSSKAFLNRFSAASKAGGGGVGAGRSASAVLISPIITLSASLPLLLGELSGRAVGRGGSVCLNSSLREDKWCPAGFRLLRIAAAG